MENNYLKSDLQKKNKSDALHQYFCLVFQCKCLKILTIKIQVLFYDKLMKIK